MTETRVARVTGIGAVACVVLSWLQFPLWSESSVRDQSGASDGVAPPPRVRWVGSSTFGTVRRPMASSKQLADLVGPTIVAMIVSEFPLVQPHLYDEQIPPVV